MTNTYLCSRLPLRKFRWTVATAISIVQRFGCPPITRVSQTFEPPQRRNPLLAIIGSLLSVAAMAVFLINFRRNYDAADPSSSLADSLAISARRPVV